MVAALNSGTVAARRLSEIYTAPGPVAEDQFADVAELVREAGGRTWADGEIRRRLDAAEQCLATLAIPRTIGTELVTFARCVVARTC
ncbi:hypothetical protein [Micromonospora sp. NPDC050276]|uniref:hypothetical protein n=1 Tax=Micromonospora sp. NPDC050276 TaxID=3364278 RepID=UPI0037B990BE